MKGKDGTVVRVAEVAKCHYGQFSENPRTIPLARFSFPPAPSLLGSESSANRLLSRENWPGNSLGPTSADYRVEDARCSDLGQLFACAKFGALFNGRSLRFLTLRETSKSQRLEVGRSSAGVVILFSSRLKIRLTHCMSP